MTYFEKIKKEFGEIIADIYADDDGAWVCLKAGYILPLMECGTIHESNFKNCYKILKEGVKAD